MVGGVTFVCSLCNYLHVILVVFLIEHLFRFDNDGCKFFSMLSLFAFGLCCVQLLVVGNI